MQSTAQPEMWAALALGAVDAVSADKDTAELWLTAVRRYQVVHTDAGRSEGVAHGCRPESGDKVAALSQGSVAFKASTYAQQPIASDDIAMSFQCISALMPVCPLRHLPLTPNGRPTKHFPHFQGRE